MDAVQSDQSSLLQASRDHDGEVQWMQLESDSEVSFDSPEYAWKFFWRRLAISIICGMAMVLVLECRGRQHPHRHHHTAPQDPLKHHLSAFCMGGAAACMCWILFDWRGYFLLAGRLRQRRASDPQLLQTTSARPPAPQVATQPPAREVSVIRSEAVQPPRFQNPILAERIQQLNERTRICTREQWEE
ncbi:unnamed protein product, partial [Polarella glacialis]